MKIACLGCGKMGGALVKAILKSNVKCEVFVTARHSEKAQAFAKENGCFAAESNREAVEGADLVILAVKPNVLKDVIDEISYALTPNDSNNYKCAVIVSVAAGVSIDSVSAWVGGEHPIVRLMPNVACQVGEGLIALCANEKTSDEDLKTVKALFEKAGAISEVDEKLIDAITCVSGSAIAFAFEYIEAMADASVMLGINRADSYSYALQTLKGAVALMKETGSDPCKLKDDVTSPAGTTIEGIAVLKKLGFQGSIIEAVRAMNKKCKAMNRASKGSRG